ncbi:MAG: ABA4-like family protein [Chloroflexota bacterium]
MDTLFAFASTLVLPFWLAIILLPAWRWTKRITRSSWLVAALAGVYAALVLPRFGSLLPAVTRPSLQAMTSLLATPDGATIAWIHFLAFDLVVGRWAYLDSRDRRLSPHLMAPILLLTLLLGPLGLLAYLSLRAVSSHALPAWSAPRLLLAQLAHLMRINRPLTLVGVLMVVTLLGTSVGLIVDPRVITGAPAWLKPAKFAVSTSIYAFTFVWLLGFVRGHQRLVALSANAVAAGLTVEVGIIVLQVVRGTTRSLRRCDSARRGPVRHDGGDHRGGLADESAGGCALACAALA